MVEILVMTKKEKIAQLLRTSIGGDGSLPQDEYEPEAGQFLDIASALKTPADANRVLTQIVAKSMGWELTQHEAQNGIFHDIENAVYKILLSTDDGI